MQSPNYYGQRWLVGQNGALSPLGQQLTQVNIDVSGNRYIARLHYNLKLALSRRQFREDLCFVGDILQFLLFLLLILNTVQTHLQLFSF